MVTFPADVATVMLKFWILQDLKDAAGDVVDRKIGID
jgi:hypothetical protein